MEFYKRDKRDSSLRSWGNGVPARIDNSERREAVLIDGISGSYGIPTSVEGRGSLEKWEGGEKIISSGSTRKKLKKLSDIRIFSVSYAIFMIFLVVFQIWL